MEKHNVNQLETRIKELGINLKSLADDDDLQELLKIIRKPGWTTPAELQFASGIVETLLVEARAMTELKRVLVNGSRAVGAKTAAGA